MGRDKVSRSLIEDVLSKVDIVDLISSYITLKPSGRNFIALCPFHSEKTPSFVVSPEKQIFKCFGCGVGGNAITFLERYENIPFREALRKLAKVAGVEIESSDDEEGRELEEAALKAANFFNAMVGKVKGYLEGRGIGEKLIERFLIGYAPRGYAQKVGIDTETLKKLSLINERGREFFSGRLIIPIFDSSGRVIAFAGRALRDKQQPKYINSPESELFKKSRTLFGLNQAKDAILKMREVIVVEGYFDVISLYGVGFENVVAPMGTSLTQEQARILKRYSERVILAFDGDSAGEKAALRAGKIFAEFGVEPFVAPIPQGEDPDSLSRSNPERLRELLNSPLPLSEWLIRRVKEAEEEERASLIREVVDTFLPFEEHDPFRFRKFLSRLSAEFGVDERWMRRGRLFRKVEGATSLKPVPWHEKAFVRGILEGFIPDDLDISPNVFLSEEYSKLFSILRAKRVKSISEIEVEHPELSGTVAEILMEEFSREEILSAALRVFEKEIDRRLKRLKRDEIERRIRLRNFALKVRNRAFNSFEEIRESLTKIP